MVGTKKSIHVLHSENKMEHIIIFNQLFLAKSRLNIIHIKTIKIDFFFLFMFRVVQNFARIFFAKRVHSLIDFYA